MSDLTRMGLTALFTTFLVIIIEFIKELALSTGYKVTGWTWKARLLLFVVSIAGLMIIWG